MTHDLLPFERSFLDWVGRHSMAWERVSFESTGTGEFTTGYHFSPAAPARAMVLALHGAGNDSLFAWVGLFKELLDQKFEVFTFDLPGHGRRNRTRFSPEEATHSVRAALNECVSRAGSRPLHAIGVSLGGSILLASLPDVQERLTSAALVVAPMTIELSPRAIVGELTWRALALTWREREHYGLTGLIPSFGPFKREIYPLRLALKPPAGAFGYVASLNDALSSLRLEDAAARVRLPTLLAYGERDRIVPVEQGARLARLIPGSELLRCAVGTHLSTPLEPEVTNKLLSWMTRH